MIKEYNMDKNQLSNWAMNLFDYMKTTRKESWATINAVDFHGLEAKAKAILGFSLTKILSTSKSNEKALTIGLNNSRKMGA